MNEPSGRARATSRPRTNQNRTGQHRDGASRLGQQGRSTQAAIELAARRVIVRKGYLRATIGDITAEAGRSPASFYNYFGSKREMLTKWADELSDRATTRPLPVIEPGVPPKDLVRHSVGALWGTFKESLPEMIGIHQEAMINDEFARRWSEICTARESSIRYGVQTAQRTGYCPGQDAYLVAAALAQMINHASFRWLSPDGAHASVTDDEAIETLSSIWFRAVYWT